MKVSPLETAVFVAGLIAAIAAGVTAYDRHGMYGDGPGGSGFAREMDPVTGASRLVHESVTSQGRLRRVFARGRSQLVEAELDRNGDGNPEECVRMVGGVLGTGFSRAGDGIIDAWAFRDASNQVTRIEISTQKDHRIDRWEYYKDGVVTRVAIDANGDGRPD